MSWYIRCGNNNCQKVCSVDSILTGGSDIDATQEQMYSEAAKSGWIIATDNDIGLSSPEKIAFCSKACKLNWVNNERLHMPISCLNWSEIYNLDLNDLQGSLNRSDMELKHRVVAQRIVNWLLEHKTETQNANAEWARWKLKAVWDIDPDIAPDDSIIEEKRKQNRAIYFLIWRAERKESLLFMLNDHNGNEHGVWHWHGYGMICPSLWLTKGSARLLADKISHGVQEGCLEVINEHWDHLARNKDELFELFEDLMGKR